MRVGCPHPFVGRCEMTTMPSTPPSIADPTETDPAVLSYGSLIPATLGPVPDPLPETADSSDAERRSVTVGVWLAVVSALGFSFKAILVKLAYPWGVDTVTLLVMRMGLALPVFLWLAWRAPRPARADLLSPRDWASLAGLGVAGYYAASILDFVGLQYISAGLERLILFAYPTFTVLIGVFVFRRGWRRREAVCLVLSYAGIALAVAHDFKISGERGAVVLGGLAVLASALCYAGYLAGSANLITRMGAPRFAAAAMGVSTLATLCHFSLTRPWGMLVQPLQVTLIALAMALFSTVLPVLALAAAIRRVGSNRAAMVGTIGPVLTIGLGWLILGEAISAWQLAGAALVIIGVRVAARH